MKSALRPVVLILGLVACGLIAVAASTVADQSERWTIRYEIDLPRRAVLRVENRLVIDVENVGDAAIPDVGLKINRAFANIATITATDPRGRIDDAPTERRIYFGSLSAGARARYTIRFSPQRIGIHRAAIRVVGASRGLEPRTLLDQSSGSEQFIGEIEVIER
ncbi:MAG: hypothetical protein FJ033_14500 [Chloroflexi bacterium]|nr:hypothetical protein [Chloroflexota bacterium]